MADTKEQEKEEVGSGWQCDKSMMECISCALDNKVACDVTFKVSSDNGLELIHAHRLLLSLRSPVFFAMFYGDLAEKGPEVEIKDVDAAAFHQIIRFMYKDKAILPVKDVKLVGKILYASKKYILPGLENQCVHFLGKILSIDNVCSILEEVILVGENSLVEVCLQLIMAKTHEVFKGTHWTSIHVKTLDKILQSPNFSVSELEVFEAVMSWSKVACEREDIEITAENQRKVLGDTLYKVHMTNISLDEFSQIVTPTGILKEVEELSVFRVLTSPQHSGKTPFESGRQNKLFILKPPRLNPSTTGECNFDSETFSYKLQVMKTLCLKEIHVYDILGPHKLNVTIGCMEDSDKHMRELNFNQLTHSHTYNEKQYEVYVFKFASSEGGIELQQAQYNIGLTLLGEFDTMVYNTNKYGDKCLAIVRKDKDSPLFALGYTVREDEEPNRNPLPPLKKGEGTAPPPPLPPRQPKHD